ncbi:MAG: ion channel [Mycobacterium kyogaense]|uniref:potassium channel family protein n=1 Tax=Mycobacterium kyogaense TaxID=2212479 RepID=UPI002FF5CBBB
METKLQAWERRAEWPLAVAALLFLAAYSAEVLALPSGAALAAIHVVSLVTWTMFIVDYLVRLSLAEQRWRWFWRHLFDLAIVALPILRHLRLLRLLTLITVLNRAVGHAIRGRVAMYTVGGAVLLIYVSSLAVLQAERHYPHAHITHFGEALWWAMTTITTVGYGDLTPVSPTGRVIAVLLMIGGISLLGSITATLASWIVERVADEDTAAQQVTTAHLDTLVQEIAQLREEVARLGDPVPRRDRPDG